jgi:hypothetical protein
MVKNVLKKRRPFFGKERPLMISGGDQHMEFI